MTTPIGFPVQQELGLWSSMSTTTPAPSASANEYEIVQRLSMAVAARRFSMQLRDAYYRGEQAVNDLGISVPPKLKWLKVPLGWPRVCVDALNERLEIQTMKCGTDGAESELGLADIWNANRLDAMASAVHLDALIFGRGYVSVGTNPNGGLPVIMVESPLDMAVDFDPVERKIKSALRLYGRDHATQATLYLPDETLHLRRETTMSEWVVDRRDTHNLGMVPIVQFVNNPRSYDLTGSSEITPELMALTDDGSRTLQSMAVNREFYSGPQRYILGANENDFQTADGSPKSAVEVYAGRILALERDENGELPEVGQFAVHDPSVFTKIIDSYTQRVAAITGLPPHALGMHTANPTSGDAIKAADDKILKRASRKAALFGPSWADVMRLALLFRDGELAPEAWSIRTVWADTSTPTPMATAQAWTMVANAGIIPKSSRVLLDKLGLTASEQEQVDADRTRDAGETFLEQLATNIQSRQIRQAESTIRLSNEVTAPDVATGTPSG